MQQNGNVNVVEYFPDLEVDKRSGTSTVRKWRGDYSSLYNIGTNLIVNDTSSIVNLRLSQPDPKSWAEMQATYKTDITSVWTVDYNQIDQSIFYAPGFLQFLTDNGGPLSASNLNQIVKGLMYGRDNQQSITDLMTSTTVAPYQYSGSFGTAYNLLNATQKNSLQLFYNEYLKGNDVFPITQPILTRISILSYYPNEGTLQPPGSAFNNVINLYVNMTDMIMTAGDIIYLFGSPPPLVYLQQMPTGGYWLYKYPRSEFLNSGKYNITQQWWWCSNYSSIAYKLIPGGGR